MLQDKAIELGRLIGQSDEYKAVKRTSDALNEDREAVTLIRDMERLRREAQAMIERGQNPTPEMEQALDELLAGDPVALAVVAHEQAPVHLGARDALRRCARGRICSPGVRDG